MIEKYAPLDKGHITTRQNIQIHHVPLPDAAKLIDEITESGLSCREGCGNTVRNVTGDPYAGVAEDEIFDPTAYGIAYVRYFVRHPTTQLMPRKIKTAFTASDADRAITGIHDVGFIPRIRDGVKGFEVVVGGGTSIMPRIAPVLYEFVGADNGDYLKVTEAALRIFDRQELAAREPRPRPDQGAGRQDRHGCIPRDGRRASSRATGSPSGTSASSTCCSTSTRSSERRARRRTSPRRTATAPSSRRSARTTSVRSARRATQRSR